MQKLFLLVFIVFLYLSMCYAESSAYVDSLKENLETENISDRLSSLVKLAEYHLYDTSELSFSYSSQARDIAFPLFPALAVRPILWV